MAKFFMSFRGGGGGGLKSTLNPGLIMLQEMSILIRKVDYSSIVAAPPAAKSKPRHTLIGTVYPLLR